jgi:hypothetical protein
MDEFIEMLTKAESYTDLICNKADVIVDSREIVNTLESLADALSRTIGTDGRPILQLLHQEGLLKKVQTETIIVTPNSQTKIKLSELNKILTEMKQGEDAVARMADLDKSHGLQHPADVARRMRNSKNASTNTPVVSTGDALGDSNLAKQRVEQAQNMEREAKGLLAEAQRLMKEAKSLDPAAAPKSSLSVKPAKAKKARAKVSA